MRSQVARIYARMVRKMEFVDINNVKKTGKYVCDDQISIFDDFWGCDVGWKDAREKSVFFFCGPLVSGRRKGSPEFCGCGKNREGKCFWGKIVLSAMG